MMVICKNLRFEERHGKTPNEFSILTNLFGCDIIKKVNLEDNFFERSLRDSVEARVDVGWPPEIEYTKICFSVGERVFFIIKKIEIK